ncbi:programmed cell death protein 2-like [Lineus longissimus]|uniref:programmed cell death protein 2-like n=1 Tax=Lineus longissimus TaxID=88925 RepID=UPI002B4C88E7
MSVLLGVCDQPVACEDETVSSVTAFTNKIGGQPDFYDYKFAIPSCPLCGKPMLLILQLYCPLDDSRYDRTIYVFTCSAPSCWSKDRCWKVIRSQKLSMIQRSESKPAKRDVEDNWCDSADDWGESADTVAMATVDSNTDIWDVGEDNWGETEEDEIAPLEKSDTLELCESSLKDDFVVTNSADNGFELSKSDPDPKRCDLDIDFKQMNVGDDLESSAMDGIVPNHCQPEDVAMETCKQSILWNILKRDDAEVTTLPPSVPHRENTEVKSLVAFYLSAFEEPKSAVTEDKHIQRLMNDYSRREGCDFERMLDESDSASGEKYEKASVRHGDHVFHKFMKRVSLCPQQCLRYSWCGHPLPISKMAATQTIQRCSCGSERVFEFQLMPALVNLLKYSAEAHTDSAPPVEFGTILVFTCPQSCWKEGDSMQEEAIIVQADPDQHLFKC